MRSGVIESNGIGPELVKATKQVVEATGADEIVRRMRACVAERKANMKKQLPRIGLRHPVQVAMAPALEDIQKSLAIPVPSGLHAAIENLKAILS